MHTFVPAAAAAASFVTGSRAQPDNTRLGEDTEANKINEDEEKDLSPNSPRSSFTGQNDVRRNLAKEVVEKKERKKMKCIGKGNFAITKVLCEESSHYQRVDRFCK